MSFFFIILNKPGMMIKTGKQISLILNDYRALFGTIDNKNPKTMYVSISSWVDPKLNKEINYTRIIRKLNKKIKDYLYNNLDRNLFQYKNPIVDLDLRESGISYNKRSFMNCEVTLFKITDDPINSKVIMDTANQIIDGLIKEVFSTSKYFTFHKTKKVTKQLIN